jgi:hypothetical protein
VVRINRPSVSLNNSSNNNNSNNNDNDNGRRRRRRRRGSMSTSASTCRNATVAMLTDGGIPDALAFHVPVFLVAFICQCLLQRLGYGGADTSDARISHYFGRAGGSALSGQASTPLLADQQQERSSSHLKEDGFEQQQQQPHQQQQQQLLQQQQQQQQLQGEEPLVSAASAVTAAFGSVARTGSVARAPSYPQAAASTAATAAAAVSGDVQGDDEIGGERTTLLAQKGEAESRDASPSGGRLGRDQEWAAGASASSLLAWHIGGKRGWFGWAWRVWTADDSFVEMMGGREGVLFLRMMRTLSWILAVVSVFSLVVLVPVNVNGGENFPGFSSTTLANVKEGCA